MQKKDFFSKSINKRGEAWIGCMVSKFNYDLDRESKQSLSLLTHYT